MRATPLEHGVLVRVRGTSAEKVKFHLGEHTRRRLLSILSPLGLLVLWQVLVMVHVLDNRFFPTPTAIVVQAYHDILSGQLQNDLKVSLIRIVLGFLAGAIPGVILGISMGLFKPLRVVLEPIVASTYPIPKLALLPLIMLMFGLGETEKVVIILLGVIFPVLINSAAGVLQLDKNYMEVAKSFGASRKDYYTTVAIPGALPMIFTGLKLGAGMALLLIVAAEMEGASAGIGYRIWISYSVFQITDMYVSFIIMALLGYIFSLLLDEIEAWVVPWK
ncbi:ABC transporter permease [Alicyclobacillus curvatus]|jgi:NitT/TauT family transport system permease protein|nr:ABC transporter permease [Alicyclobacillus curvatus]